MIFIYLFSFFLSFVNLYKYFKSYLFIPMRWAFFSNNEATLSFPSEIFGSRSLPGLREILHLQENNFKVCTDTKFSWVSGVIEYRLLHDLGFILCVYTCIRRVLKKYL